MRSVTDRVVGDFLLGPLTANESLNYLYNKLRASGAAQPDNIFPVDVCDELHALSGGWPGKLDGMAKSTIDHADRLPIQLNNVVGSGSGKQLNYREDVIETLQQTENVPPKLMVTINGETLQEIELRAPKTLIGRSVLSDVFINSKFISKHHALLIHVQNTILLVDLKSTNGTLVNSRKIQSRILRPDDIISLGNHRIKVVYPNSRPFVDIEDPKDIDTVAMKNVADARRAVTNEELRFSNMNKQIEGFSLNSGR
jgi:pSer/pThr/pTyr-binding forkhead associated (FHA) protein